MTHFQQLINEQETDKEIEVLRRTSHLMLESSTPRPDFVGESAPVMMNRHFTFHIGQNDVQPKKSSFANTIDDL